MRECMLCRERGWRFDYLSIDKLDLIGQYCPVFTGNYRYFPVFPARPGNKAGVREICQPCLPLSRSLQFPKCSCSDLFSFFFSTKYAHVAWAFMHASCSYTQWSDWSPISISCFKRPGSVVSTWPDKGRQIKLNSVLSKEFFFLC